MEIDELRKAWNEMNERLAKTEGLLIDLKQEAGLQKTKSALNRFRNLPMIELVSGLALAILYGDWYSLGPYTPQYMGSLGILFILNIAGIIGAAWQLARLSQADYSGPVLALQKILAEIHAVRAFTVKWGLIFGCLIWVPAYVVIAQACFHFDIIARFGWLYTGANLGFGLFVILFCLWFEKQFGSKLARKPGVKRILDDMTGRSLANAVRSLDEVNAFAN